MKNVFDSYTNTVFDKKLNAKDKAQKTTAKSFLNNLLGRFGMSIDKPVVKIISEQEFSKITCLYNVHSD